MALYNKRGAVESWSRTIDRTARTQAARDAQRAQIAQEIDPEGLMDEETRRKAVKAAWRARCLAMAEKSARVRRERKAAREATGDGHACSDTHRPSAVPGQTSVEEQADRKRAVADALAALDDKAPQPKPRREPAIHIPPSIRSGGRSGP